MGSSASKTSHYVIKVTTGDKKGAGADANVYCAFIDEQGNRSRDIKLDNIFKNDFERKKTDTFKIKGILNLGTIIELEVWRDTCGIFNDWYLQVLTVEIHNAPNGQKKMHHFPVHRWISTTRHHFFLEFDSILPQYSRHEKDRAQELEDKRELYEFRELIPDFPPGVLYYHYRFYHHDYRQMQLCNHYQVHYQHRLLCDLYHRC